jgi:RHS repeat-associated protein
MYVYLSNEEPTQAPIDVYFDDFKVTQVHSKVVAGGDYYPFGLPMNTRQVTDEPYRFGYQRQFAERDSLTNWNTFQLRMYDARFGRWLSADPYGQFDNPYIGMGNNPVSGIDPDGGIYISPKLIEAIGIMVETGAFPLPEVVVMGSRIMEATAWESVKEFGKDIGRGFITSFRRSTIIVNGINQSYAPVIPDYGGDNKTANNLRNQGEVFGYGTQVILSGMNGGTVPMSGGRPVLATPNASVPIVKPVVVPITTTLDVHRTVYAKSPVNRVNTAIKKGQAPKTIKRADTGKIFGEKDHVHFTDDSALNIDGTWKHGGRPLSNAEKTFLNEHGWTLPNL